MITVVIGHRGTGKTELVKRLWSHLRDQDIEFLDLDEEIEKKIGKKIFELVMENGEAYFRELERQIFLECLQKPHKDMYLVLGAGFDLKAIPESVRVLWVRRKTDVDGRIFLDRPRLDPDISPLNEFRKRAEVREKNYAQVADEVYEMPEGVLTHHNKALALEKNIVTHNISEIGGVLTLMPGLFTKLRRWENFKARFAQKGVDIFELRDDLLSIENIRKVVGELSGERFMLSFRQNPSLLEEVFSPSEKSWLDGMQWVDWALELGAPPEMLRNIPAERLVISSHEASGKDRLMGYAKMAALLKWSPEVHTFAELWQGHLWQKEQPQQRVFLPRSAEGRWSWYRLLQKKSQALNFWRYDEGSAADQPNLFSWMITPQKVQKFAAILGDPVSHSFTPIEHSDFFAKRGIPVLAIKVAREEWDEAFPILQKMGLGYAAITAPHKQNAAGLVEGYSGKSLNTLFWSESQQQWLGTSTDEEGFLELIEGVGMIAPLQKEIYIWGGGGTLEMLEKTLPHASYFSSRTASPRLDSEDAVLLNPKVVVWAAPRSPETQWPPAHWSPAMVFDMNYKEDSMGREYSLRCGAHYQSGITMFVGQALGQKRFWMKCEDSE